MTGKKNQAEEPLLSIGAFARAAGVTVKALRHWDERGLLRAASADSATGYRRYRLEQLAAVDMLERSKDMGLAMAELRALAAGSGLAAVSELPPEAVFRVARRRLEEAREKLLRSERYLEDAERRCREEAELGRSGAAAGEKPVRLWRASAPVSADLRAGIPDRRLQEMLSDFLEELKGSGASRRCDWGLLVCREKEGAAVSAFIEAGEGAEAAEGVPGLLSVPAGFFSSELVSPEGPLWPEIAKRLPGEGALLAFHLCGWLRSPGGAMSWEAEEIRLSVS